MPRPRKSLAEHKLNSTTPAYVVPGSSVEPSRPRYPKGVSKAARKEFKRLCVVLEKRRSLTEGDEHALRLFAILFDRHSEAVAKLAEEGTIRIYFRLDNQGKQVASERPNLWLKVAQESEKQMVAILRELGLTPMNRAKVRPTEVPKEAEPVAPEDKLLERPGSSTPVAEDPLDEFEGLDLEAIQ